MGNPAPHRARKRFGQHFLHDQSIIRQMLSALNPKIGQSIVEIGPGQGALTFPLLQRCGQLTAIELDRDLIPILQNKAQDCGELQLINADILSVELKNLALNPPLRIIGNLPYNISTPLMFHLLGQSQLITDMHFMLQKEVAQRITATVENSSNRGHYGRLTIMMQYYCQAEYLFDVPPGCFSPPPKVDSAVIRLLPHKNPPVQVDRVDLLETVVQTAFSQRRKTIANSLKKIIGGDTIRALGIDSGARAENLTLQEFAQLAQTLNKMS